MSYLLIKVGSERDNDVVFNDPSVSPHHLEIFVDVEGNAFATDLGSEYGTFLNGERIYDSVELGPSDELTLGRGIRLDWRKQIAESEKDHISVGKSPANDFVLDSVYASEFHLQLYKDHQGNYFISDLNSAHGTYLNGNRLKSVALLSIHDEVRIGRDVFEWRALFPELKMAVEAEKASRKVEINPIIEVEVKNEAESAQKLPWYIEYKEILIIYGIDLLLLLLISYQLSD